MAGHTAGVGGRIPAARAIRPTARIAMAVLAALGCASGLPLEGGRYHNERRGYHIDRPAGDWERVGAERADLALRGPEGQLMSVSSRCHTPLASPRILARHLRIGLGAYRMRAGAPVEVDGHPGWMQLFDARDGTSFVRVKTVTGVAGPCVYDFVLVARRSFPSADRAFDHWWRSFRLEGPGPGAAP